MLGVEGWSSSMCVRVHACKVKMEPRPHQRGGLMVPMYSRSQITEVLKDCSLIISVSKIISFEHFKPLVLLFIKPI